MPIQWWRGDPALVNAARYRSERELGGWRGVAGGARGAYDQWQAYRDEQEKSRAALLRAQHRAVQQGETAHPPGVQDESALGAETVAGPGEEARNLTGAGVPGAGAGSTPSEDTALSRAMSRGGSATAPAEGPFPGDEPDIIRAMRGIGAFARIPGVRPTQPGLSSEEQEAALVGDRERLVDENARLGAYAPFIQRQREPMEAAGVVAPYGRELFGVSAEAGGGRLPPARVAMSKAEQVEKQAEQYAIEDGRNYVTAADRERAFRAAERPPAAAREAQPFTEESTTEVYYVDPETGEETSAWTPGAIKKTRQRKTRTPGGQAGGAGGAAKPGDPIYLPGTDIQIGTWEE